MVRKVSPILLLLFLLFLCGSWGKEAHRKVNATCVEFFPKRLAQLKTWGPIMADHGSDADSRKKNDPDEFVRHFIDIDLYDEFTASGKIPENFEALCKKYGRDVVMKYGTLPWVTDSTYKALVQDFRNNDWQKAVLTAADLGHYVGDGFMPLHISGNYDGQLSGQKGIHRRYEETMIDKYIDQIAIEPSRIGRVKDVQGYVFGYLYRNHANNNLLLQADKRALDSSGGEYNEVYYQNLWGSTNLFTSRLLQEASKTLASLIYSAWLEAGKPALPKK